MNMKKIIMALACLMTVVLSFTSCETNPKEKIQSNLEQVVIEKGMGFVKKCTTISIDIDTITINDLKAFVTKTFPEGIPNDYEDETFEKFILPIKNNSNNNIVYLSIKHKYKIFMVGDPFKRDEVIVTAYRLVDPVTYEYLFDDLSKDETWTTPQEYLLNKQIKELFN